MMAGSCRLVPSEIEFLAEKQMVSIIPKFTQNHVIYLILGNIGPFTSGLPVEVPLWLAVNLRQQLKCDIILPDWLSIESLEQKKAAEAESQFFTPPPHSHYMEMSKLLLQYAVDDVPKADEIRTLVKDIWDLRITKLRTSMDQFISSDSMVARVNNLTVMEINYVREFLDASLSVRQKLKANKNLNYSVGDSQLHDSRLNDSRFSSSSAHLSSDTF
ncbi:DNA replication complex GINS protein PSF2-like [Watersipora subatra]|uniref:DNA replication complex GINS protein PSF2-like n=1 Tax=Watersipora subatra TaxID=2589382 RepID=UPI00355BFC87